MKLFSIETASVKRIGHLAKEMEMSSCKQSSLPISSNPYQINEVDNLLASRLGRQISVNHAGI